MTFCHCRRTGLSADKAADNRNTDSKTLDSIIVKEPIFYYLLCFKNTCNSLISIVLNTLTPSSLSFDFKIYWLLHRIQVIYRLVRILFLVLFSRFTYGYWNAILTYKTMCCWTFSCQPALQFMYNTFLKCHFQIYISAYPLGYLS